MGTRTVKCVVAAVALVALSFAHSATEPQSRSAESLDDYRIVWERNIFSPDRGTRRRQEESEARVKPEYRPERDIVLRGVSERGDRCVAFLENLQSGATTRVQEGEEIARGKVKTITLDRIEYESNGRVTEVAVGQTLEAAVPEAPIDYGAFGDIASSGPPGPAPDTETGTEEGGEPTEDEAAILEKLMRQRQEELQ